jgi:hypothetical protein
MVPVFALHHPHRRGGSGRPKNPVAVAGAAAVAGVVLLMQNMLKSPHTGSAGAGVWVVGGIALGLVCAVLGFVLARAIGRQGRL